jgi:conjugative relaxase-like TrwC/TraI family protein
VALGGVLSIGKLAAGQQSYYLNAVAAGVEDYYTGSGEAPGRWIGNGSDELGLRGRVDDDDLHAVLSGLDPRSGALIGRANRKLPGFDATFSAPKSASLLFALGSTEVSRQVRDAHDAAVAAALGYLERQACVVRRGHNGTEQGAGSGFVAAAFRHRTSRAGDPQLHTHALIANAARGGDGRWGALDGRLLYLHRMVAGFLYQAQLRHELTKRLGVRWQPVRKGLSEIDGVPHRVLRAFSRRRIEIEARLGELGVDGVRASEVAALDTRRAKAYGVDGESLRSDWKERADALGFGRRDIAKVLGRGSSAVRPPSDEVLGRALTEHASTFDRRHVLQALSSAATDGAEIAAIETRADRFLAGAEAVAIGTGHAGTRWSTAELLAVEARVLSAAVRHRDDGVGTVEGATVDRVLAARPHLAEEQVAMLRSLTGSGAAVEVVVGVAGSGKTVALDAARAAWSGGGYHVIGAALAARAAAELEAASGIPSFTIASLLRHLEGAHQALPTNTVVVVDEAAMVGTRQCDRLLRHVLRAKAKLVLVGDHRQLPEVDAGGIFRGLLSRLGASELVTNRRQRDPAERAALADLRAGRVRRAVEALEAAGRVETTDDVESLAAGITASWWDAKTAGRDVVMLTLGRAEAEGLNRRARAVLDDAGKLGARRLQVGGREFAVGDEVIGTRNWRSIGILNGTRGRVVGVDERRSALDVETSNGVRIHVPAEYLLADHLRHAYATTIHKAQGRTCDVALLWGDERLYQEAGYSALTRGRDANRVYFVREHEETATCGPRTGGSADLVDALLRSQAQTLATVERDGSSVA